MKWEYARTIEELQGLRTEGKTVIDVGAGFGYFLDLVKEKFFRTSDISAVDYNETSLSVLQAKGFKTFSSDLRADSFAPMKEAFDIIFMFQVFEHMDRVDEVFARLKYLLKPQGCVFIAVPSANRTYCMEAHGSLIDMPPKPHRPVDQRSVRFDMSAARPAIDQMRAGAVQPCQVSERRHRRQLSAQGGETGQRQ
jgi:ubiquinone/menaquinone biosynthesis C-methylase UbiE